MAIWEHLEQHSNSTPFAAADAAPPPPPLSLSSSLPPPPPSLFSPPPFSPYLHGQQVARILAFFDDVAGCLEGAEGPLHSGNIATALHVLAALKHRRGSSANWRSWSACRLLELVVALVGQAPGAHQYLLRGAGEC